MADSQPELPDQKPGLIRKHPLFCRPDGTPYEFWVQHDMDAELRESVQEYIMVGGGRILSFGEFPQHGFLIIDPVNPSALYEIRTSFDKPLDLGIRPYCRSKSIPATPLRHVVSYLFVLTAHERGTWNEFDLVEYGFPLEVPRVEGETLEDTSSRLRAELPRGIDQKMEEGWVWASGDLFSRFDRSYKFANEFADLEHRLDKELVPNSKDINKIRRFERGLIVTRRKWMQTTKFFVHDSVSPRKRRKAVQWITENGGFTCCDEHSCDFVLLECSVDAIHETEEIFGILWNIFKESREAKARNVGVMHVDWILMSQDVGTLDRVDKSQWNLLRNYTNQYGRSKPKFAPGSFEQRKKRKRDAIREELEWRFKHEAADVESTIYGPEEPPRKKARLESDNARTFKPPAAPEPSGRRPEGLFSVQPRRIFEGISVPGHGSSLRQASRTPVSRSMATSARLDSTKTSHPRIAATSSLFPSNDNTDARQEPVNDEHTHQELEDRVRKGARISAVSGLTTETAQTTTSKGENTTTTGTLNSARSVGPGNPPNPKQIGRPSGSTVGSGASRGPAESSTETAPRAIANLFRTPAIPTNLEADDVAVEEILSHFDPTVQADKPNKREEPAEQKEFADLPFEQRLISYWNDLVVLDDEELVHLEELVNGWPVRAKKKVEMNRKRKGKGRVSFASPTGQHEDVVPETDLDDPVALGATDDPVPPSRVQPAHTVDSKAKPDQLTIPTPPQAKARISRQRISSKTPDSHNSSDSEDSEDSSSDSDSDSEPARETKVAVAKSLRDPPPLDSNRDPEDETEYTHGKLDSDEAKFPELKPKPSSIISNENQPVENPAADGTVPHPNMRVARSRKNESPVQEKQATMVEENGEEDEVPPLPSPKLRRNTRLRSTSVTSDRGAVDGTFKPRRGRSASAAPPDIPANPKTITVAPVKRRGKYAVKSTGGRPPRRR
ncbi:hypothetical protein FRC18_004355 [Serendipita sp. 400]|nr:hypothetical protein FRC18_004355 [Serendipita sp. 400]